MMPVFLNQNGYTSCMKIAGIPIIPPLITDERRNQLKEEKAKAIEIEKRIKRKRTSIDSGVMTGSYIDNFKNGEPLLAENSTCHELSISDLSSSNLNALLSETPLSESNSTDSFLKSALEDSEFREFFCSTADKIFKDNKLIESTSSHLESSKATGDDIAKNINSCNKQINSIDITTDSEAFTQQSNLSDLTVRDKGTLSYFSVKNDNAEILKKDATMNMTGTNNEHQCSPPPARRVRRNSYTLDSPSPVLLEHMAKGNTSPGKISEDWHVPSETRGKGLGFKTFSDTKRQRKTWNKNTKVCSSPKLDILPGPKVPNVLSNKSKTFVKTDKLHDFSNYSLPNSSCSSPTRLSNFAYSSDCVKSVYKNSFNCISTSNFELNVDDANKPNEGLEVLHQPEKSHALENKTTVTDINNDSTLEGLAKDLPDTLSSNNTSGSSCPNYETVALFPSTNNLSTNDVTRIAFIDRSSSSFIQQSSNHTESSFEHTKIPSNEIDETVSVCSSLSLSKFIPNLTDDNLSRPSTAEDLSALFSELQVRHERQIAELLEMQHKEKIILSKLHSNSTSVRSESTTKIHSNSSSISSQSSANVSVTEFPFNDNPGTGTIEKRSPFNRELFPSSDDNRSSPKEVAEVSYKHNSEREKIAAVKLTAYVRGYLTRRLLKTERVQQLIDTIKESLNCAVSLQLEVELRKNDLELHERLAHQLTSALYELQSIISAPVAMRMSVIATDREKLRKPVSRPSSAISSATQKSLLRRQKSLNNSEKKSQENNNHKSQKIRPRTKSLCLAGTSGTGASGKTDCSSSSNRKPWR